MRVKKLISAIIAGILFIVASSGISCKPFESHAVEEVNSGLIEKCSISCISNGNGNIKIIAKTQVRGLMQEIGYYDMKIQYSDDCQNWTDEKILEDTSEKDTGYFIVNGVSADVEGGHYYRVTCVHRAKGELFNTYNVAIQNTWNSSKPVWVDEKPDIITYSTLAQGQNVTTSTSSVTSATTVTTTSVTAGTSVTAKTTISTITDVSSLKTVSAKTTAKTEKSNETAKTATKTTVYEKITEKLDSPDTNADYPVTALTILVTGLFAVFKFRKKKD